LPSNIGPADQYATELPRLNLLCHSDISGSPPRVLRSNTLASRAGRTPSEVSATNALAPAATLSGEARREGRFKTPDQAPLLGRILFHLL
jgi:hypothetical protein